MGPAVIQVPVQAGREPEISLQYTYLGGDSLQLFLLFEDRQQVMQVDEATTQLTYEVRSGINDQDQQLLNDTLQLKAIKQKAPGGKLSVRIVLPSEVVRTPNVLHLQLWQLLENKVRIGSMFQVPLEAAMLQKEHLLIEARNKLPVIRNYATTSEQLKVTSATDSSYTSIQFIGADFAPALPPMSTRPDQQPRTLQVTDALTAKAGDTLQFERAGLYLVWADKPYASGLLVQPWAYPEITIASEMIAPLIYLTSSEERDKLTNSSDPKKAVDLFWQQIAGNTTVARYLIKEFYGRVEMANKLYTSHKQGWATDRGMIHIVFGRPDEISNAKSDEVWIYRQTSTRPYIKFVFTKKQNNFTENHYELVRRRDYQEVWYSTVAKWRAGITEM